LGVIHGDQMPFILGNPLNDSLKYTSSEKILSKSMLKYWSNFVQNDDPNGVDIDIWPKYKIKNLTINESMKAYINLRSPIQYGSSFKAEYCEFWNYYLRSLINSTNKNGILFSFAIFQRIVIGTSFSPN